MVDTQPIESVAELISQLQKLNLASKTQLHWRHWFRGHSKVGWLLEPGVYRDNFGNFLNQGDRLKSEQSLYQQFRVMSAGLRAEQESVEEIYFLQQHYRMPTRLLDWTTSALAALYFACCGDPDVDGEIFFLDAYKFEPRDKQSGIATSRRKEFCEAMEVINKWKKIADFPDDLIPVRPDTFDRRITLQRSCFTFHVPKHPELTVSENPSLKKWVVLARKKQAILRELSLLGIDDFSIYGDLEHLAEWLKKSHNVRP